MSYLAVALLIAITAVWDWTFVVVRDAVLVYPVAAFLAIRFVIASAALAPMAVRRLDGARAGLLPGVALAASYLFQTLGLQHTTASKAGLLTGLFVVFTPVVMLVAYRSVPRPVTVAAVIVALAGTWLLADPTRPDSGDSELLGDGLEVLTGLCLAVHILLLHRAARRGNAPAIALVQMMVAAVLFCALAAGTGGFRPPSAEVWGALVITGLLASAVAFWVQSWAQEHIAPERTAIVLVTEPAFATLFGMMLAGDRFAPLQGIGAALILIALLVHEVYPLWRARFRSAASAPAQLDEESRTA